MTDRYIDTYWQQIVSLLNQGKEVIVPSDILPESDIQEIANRAYFEGYSLRHQSNDLILGPYIGFSDAPK